MRIADLLPALHAALVELPDFEGLPEDALEVLPTSGSTGGHTHDHVLIEATGKLLRVPRQSRMGRDAKADLDYQAACFERMADSGHTPEIFGTLPPSEDIPTGALILEAIRGRTVEFPNDMDGVAEALATIHDLPVPDPADRPPLPDQENPYRSALEEVEAKANYLDAALAEDPDGDVAAALIREEIEAAKAHADSLTQADVPPPQLIAFDAHPGNFIKSVKGRAVLMDLDKGRYGGPGFDLAQATLYTSTTWDRETYSEPDHEAMAAFYAAWLNTVSPTTAEAHRAHLLAMRRLMWLRSINWCAKWRVESRKAAGYDGMAHTDPIRDRVDCYLTPDVVERVRADWRGRHALTALLS